MAALICLIFFLKVICPIEIGCLSDPFLLILFLPLSFLEKAIFIPASYEPLTILAFWMLAGAITGFLVPNHGKRKDPSESDEEDDEDEKPQG